MKNQYVGDIGDYGKYALLRAFANEGIKVGVNWYLTEDDGSNDGKFTEYLRSDELRWRAPEVFDALKEIAFNTDKSVVDIENKTTGASIKKFYKCMADHGEISKDKYKELCTLFKEEMADWQEECRRFNDDDDDFFLF